MPNKPGRPTTSVAHIPTSLRMRKLNLNLPSDYYKRVGNAQNRPLGLTRGPLGTKPPGTRPKSKPISESALKSVLEKAKSLKTKIEIKRGRGRVEISLTGVTSEIMPPVPKSSKERTTLGVKVGYDGTVSAYKAHVYKLGQGLLLKEKISTASGQPFRLEYSHKQLAIALTFKSNDKKGMSFDRWEFSISWGNVGPDLQSLGEILKKGEESARSVLGAIQLLDSLDDVKKVTDAVKPHVEPIQKSVKSVASIMKVQQGINLSFKIEGPCQKVRIPLGTSLEDRIKAGVKGMIYLTVRF
ncbi:hypothetical protein [uncultured Desulfobacter sp.]|uniref:hypothetical protein n=1 Tax=uncultured Desulfobacter sp. TaxID=240139 RepID=UPI0029C9B0C7|nr:hypothetical protein [uncultured Desulfobacter sp.]